MITVLVYYERISLFHTMEPFFAKRFRKYLTFTQSPEYCLKKDRNSILFMERWFKNDLPPDLGLMRKLSEKYKKIVFFDGYAAAGTHLLEVLPYVDRFFHKSVFVVSNNYRKDLYAKRLFADYYHKKYGITDSNPEYRFVPELSDDDLSRIELSWNIGVGDYPRKHTLQRIGTAIARYLTPDIGRLFRTGHSYPPPDFASGKRSLGIHSRLGLVSSESVAMNRQIYIAKMKDKSMFVRGQVPQNQYYTELFNSKIVFSPFGWGEVCFRDFEAVIAGAMLLKPDMSHMVTFPDIYIPYETYVPVDWDGNDFLVKSEEYLKNDAERSRIAENAWVQYRQELFKLNKRFEKIFYEVIER